MVHSSGYCVYYDTPSLSEAQPTERLQMLGTLIEGIERHEVRAGNTAMCLAMDMLPDTDGAAHSVSNATETSHGKLATSQSLKLLTETPRMEGFISAIKRWPTQEHALDVGTGPFPIFALATALYHPKAAITAVEMNSHAAEAAAKITQLFGLADRIRVVHADIAEYPIDPNTTAAVTETFNSGLQAEPGPKIVRLLHNAGIPRITPSKANLRLSMPNGKFYQEIDLREDTHADIAFSGWVHDTETPLGDVNISTEYHDNSGLVLAYDADWITRKLGVHELLALRRALSTAPASGRVTYELGTALFKPLIKEEPSNK